MEETKNSNSAKQKKLEEIQKRLAEIQSKSPDKKRVATKSKTTASDSLNKNIITGQSKQPDSATTKILDSKSKSSAPKQSPSVEKDRKPHPIVAKKSSPAQNEQIAKGSSTTSANAKSGTSSKKLDNNINPNSEDKQPQKDDSKWKENNIRKQASIEIKKENIVPKKSYKNNETKKKSNSRALVIAIISIIILFLAFIYVWQFTELFITDKSVLSEKTKAMNTSPIAEAKEKSSLLQEGQIIISFSSNENELTAISNVQHLSASGYDAAYFWIPSLFNDGASLYKVYTGPYASIEEAIKQLEIIQQISKDAYLLKAPIENL